MDEKMNEQWNRNNQDLYQSWRQLSNINAELVRRMTDLQLNLAALGIEGGSEQLKLLSGKTDYKDLLAAESELAATYSNKLLSLARETADTLGDTRDELMSWLEDSMAKTAESFKAPGSASGKRSAGARKASASAA